jgi:prevent-host-death family protein
VYGSESPDGPIILDTIDAVTGSIAFVVDPAHRRQGFATNMIRADIEHPDLTMAQLFGAGVEPDNHESRGALEAAGFRCVRAGRTSRECSATNLPAACSTRATLLRVARDLTQRELRNESGEIMRALDAGESFVVTRNGVPVGELTPVRRRRFVERDATIAAFRAAAPLDPRRWRTDLDRHAS